MSKAVRRIKGGIIILLLFITIVFVVLKFFDKPNPHPNGNGGRISEPLLTISYQLVGNGRKSLGPPSDSVTTGLAGYYWFQYHIVVSNNCNQKIHINASKFQLKNMIFPSTIARGYKYQEDRLKSKLLEPGEKVQGNLYFVSPPASHSFKYVDPTSQCKIKYIK